MPCFNPIKGYRSKTVNPSGKRSITLNPKEAEDDKIVQIKCGQCIGCRIDRSKEWAVRCLHEASLYEENTFLTLTYADEHLPPDGSLRLADFQKFMKRLRFENKNRTIRFFHCGEYGEKFGRPHYHAILFNFDFDDKTYSDNSPSGEKLYYSPKLERLWPHGRARIGNVTFKSAAYVARYILKKFTGPDAWMYYDEIDHETGEVLKELKPEYVTMSRRPGVATEWFKKFKTDVFPDDFVVIDGKKVKTPSFYLRQLEKIDPMEHEYVTENRKEKIKKHRENNTWRRLKDREEILHRTVETKLIRGYESED